MEAKEKMEPEVEQEEELEGKQEEGLPQQDPASRDWRFGQPEIQIESHQGHPPGAGADLQGTPPVQVYPGQLRPLDERKT